MIRSRDGSDRAIVATAGAFPTVNAIPPTAPTATIHDRVHPGGWGVDQRKTIYLCALALGACVFFATIYGQIIWASYREQTPGHLPLYGDFFALWSYAKVIATHPVAELYDFAVLHARQIDLGMDPAQIFPFPYPPIFIFLVSPLSLFQYEVDYLIWTFGTLALLVWVVWKTCSRLPLCLFGLIVAPVTTATIFAGQGGFLAASLMTAGIRITSSRPIVAGILLGLLSYKPQLGLLIPVALAAAGLWTVFAAACITVIGMAAAATLAFGSDIWATWLAMLPAYADLFDNVTTPLKSRPTIMANLQLLGVPLIWARAVQATVSAAVAIVVWRCFRRNTAPTGLDVAKRRLRVLSSLPSRTMTRKVIAVGNTKTRTADTGRLAAAALLVGTVLTTPHAFVYDLPMVTVAMVLFIDDRVKTSAIFSSMEVLILVLAMLFPVVMMLKDIAVPISAVSLLLLFGVIVRAPSRAGGETA